jgi:hypothetical protein
MTQSGPAFPVTRPNCLLEGRAPAAEDFAFKTKSIEMIKALDLREDAVLTADDVDELQQWISTHRSSSRSFSTGSAFTLRKCSRTSTN